MSLPIETLNEKSLLELQRSSGHAIPKLSLPDALEGGGMSGRRNVFSRDREGRTKGSLLPSSRQIETEICEG
jgi:hypothetical protein